MIRRPSSNLAALALAFSGICLGMFAFADGAPALADVIVSYNLAAAASTTTRSTAAAVHADVTASSYTASGGTAIAATGTHYVQVDTSSGKLATLDAAIANNVYGEFSVTVDSGMRLDLSSLAFGMRNDRGVIGEVFTVHLRSSLDNYASDVASVSQVRVDNATTQGPTLQSITLNSAAFRNLTGTTTFRLYMVTNIVDHAGSQFVRITPNIALNGTISAVPEPGTCALAGLGGLFMLCRRLGAPFV